MDFCLDNFAIQRTGAACKWVNCINLAHYLHPNVQSKADRKCYCCNLTFVLPKCRKLFWINNYDRQSEPIYTDIAWSNYNSVTRNYKIRGKLFIILIQQIVLHGFHLALKGCSETFRGWWMKSWIYFCKKSCRLGNYQRPDFNQ